MNDLVNYEDLVRWLEKWGIGDRFVAASCDYDRTLSVGDVERGDEVFLAYAARPVRHNVYNQSFHLCPAKAESKLKKWLSDRVVSID